MTSSQRSKIRPFRLLPILAIAIALLCGVLTQPAWSDETERTSNTGDTPFQFLSQTSFVPANGDYELTFSGPGQDPLAKRAVVDITLYTALDETSSLATQPQDLFNRLPAQPITNLLNDANEVELAIQVRNSSNDDPTRVLLPDPGVYPIVVEFRVDDVVLQTVRTNLIRLPVNEPDADGNPQPVPSSELPAIAVGLDATQDGFTLADTNRLMTGAGDTPILVVIDQSSIERLQTDDLDSRAFIRNANQLQLVISPGNDADISTLASVDQTALHHDRLRRLQEEAQGLGLSIASEVSVIPSPLTSAGAEALTDINISTVLYTEPGSSEVKPPTTRFTTLPTNASEISVIPAHAFPPGDNPPELWPHQVTSALTIDQRQSGNQPTFIYVGPKTAPGFGPDLLQVLVDGNNVAFRVEPIEALTTDLEILEPAELPVADVTQHQGTVESIVSQINTYETTYLDGNQTPTMFSDDLTATFDATKTDQERIQKFDQLRRDLRSEIQTVNLPSGQAVTVAAEMVPVPLTIENNSDGSRQVRLVSDSDKVEIGQDGQVLTIPPGGSSIDLDVEVRSLGVSPVQISLFTPDGKNRLASTRFEVRSTAIPGLGLLLCLLGAVLLAFWWYVHAKRRRNKKHDTQGDDIDNNETSRRQASSSAASTSTDNHSKVESATISAKNSSGGNLT